LERHGFVRKGDWLPVALFAWWSTDDQCLINMLPRCADIFFEEKANGVLDDIMAVSYFRMRRLGRPRLFTTLLERGAFLGAWLLERIISLDDASTLMIIYRKGRLNIDLARQFVRDPASECGMFLFGIK
jgi:hypothetical protein